MPFLNTRKIVLQLFAIALIALVALLVLTLPALAKSPPDAPHFSNSANAFPPSDKSAAPFLRPELSADYVNFIADSEIVHGDTSQQAMALTFDCGGNAASLQYILNTLESNSVTGTFFLEGNFVHWKPEIVPLILNGGHELGNHSYTHPKFTTLTQTQVISELSRTETAISTAAKESLPMRYFRFPYGDRNKEVRRWVAEQGYQSVFWDIDPQGWRKTMTATAVISSVLNNAHPGGIVLMHCNAPADEAALPDVIAGLQAMGYRLDSLSNILPAEELAW
ncbi:MAG TPA: polysaccharide deacetylase family protein [Chloroflexi bacterium]|nr:polysaccharide deacetylase family protein [Chloroflexota bacterium]